MREEEFDSCDNCGQEYCAMKAVNPQTTNHILDYGFFERNGVKCRHWQSAESMKKEKIIPKNRFTVIEY